MTETIETFALSKTGDNAKHALGSEGRRIIEAFTLSKTGDNALNEDTFTVSEQIIAVFDGETNKGQQSAGQKTTAPGRCAALALAETAEVLQTGQEPEVVVETLNRAVATMVGVGENVAAVGAVLDVAARRVIRVGDVAVGINGVFDNRMKLLDQVSSAARAALLATLLSEGRTIDELLDRDPGRELIMPLLKANPIWRNRAGTLYGYPSLDGTSTPPEMIDVFEVPADAEVILASDGYTDPRSTLQQTEEALARSLSDDPLRIGTPPGTKPQSRETSASTTELMCGFKCE